MRDQARKCLRCGAAVVVPVAATHRHVVIKRGCPQCVQYVKLRPLAAVRPHWLVDGEYVPVPSES